MQNLRADMDKDMHVEMCFQMHESINPTQQKEKTDERKTKTRKNLEFKRK